MAETLTKLVINCATGERSVVELTAEEIAEREASAQRAEAERLAKEAATLAQEEAKASAIAKLTALGLTEAEALALAGN